MSTNIFDTKVGNKRMLAPTDTSSVIIGSSNDIDDFPTRAKLPASVILLNFQTWTRGYCLERDGVVLGQYPGVTNPFAKAKEVEAVLVSFYLHHDITTMAMKTYLDKYKTPVFEQSINLERHARMMFKHPVKSNEQWISPGLNEIHWKKRKWGLSAHMRDIASVKFPQWVIVLTPKINGLLNYGQSVRTAPFAVRSKKQPAASAFVAGGTTSKRRTPETYRAEQTLKAEQSDILRLNDSIKSKRELSDEFKSRFEFALTIAGSDPRTQHLCADIIKHIRFHKM
jgi:hypothetical protein